MCCIWHFVLRGATRDISMSFLMLLSHLSSAIPVRSVTFGLEITDKTWDSTLDVKTSDGVGNNESVATQLYNSRSAEGFFIPTNLSIIHRSGILIINSQRIFISNYLLRIHFPSNSSIAWLLTFQRVADLRQHKNPPQETTKAPTTNQKCIQLTAKSPKPPKIYEKHPKSHNGENAPKPSSTSSPTQTYDPNSSTRPPPSLTSRITIETVEGMVVGGASPSAGMAVGMANPHRPMRSWSKYTAMPSKLRCTLRN